ncbi:olfactory receptor 14A16-like [Varanus komodoensis]|uniref:olfactory receptor 14A16-like n=1 Tax=Varanus komodoensis TaxID=61221 RepID=UPI001CF7C347|nr:olfactory receptor 14A16-like [Varanus komodoensis]
MENQSKLEGSALTEFLLLGFSEVQEQQILHFVVFLSIYLATLTGNFLIILTVASDPQLHSPKYFFLINLSPSDMCYISTTVPKSMAASLTSNRQIFFTECIAQVFLVITLAGAELSFLTVMAYDRYVAICHPLQYRLIMNWSTCFQMAAASWIGSIINATVHTVSTFRLEFCSSSLNQFFCDIPQLWMVSCTDTAVNELITLVETFFVCSSCLLFILVSYGFIFSAVFKIQSEKGRHKVFSTCAPHLTVLSLFLSTAVFSYCRPKALSSPSVNMLAAILYTVMPPLLNPLIYSLRNQDICRSMSKICKKLLGFHNAIPCPFLKNIKVSLQRNQFIDMKKG